MRGTTAPLLGAFAAFLACTGPVPPPPSGNARSILLLFADPVQGRPRTLAQQGSTEFDVGIRATIEPPALLLGYEEDLLPTLGLEQSGEVPLTVGAGMPLPTPTWSYTLEEGAAEWRALDDATTSDLFRNVRIPSPDVCACAARKRCFSATGSPACVACATPPPPITPAGLNTLTGPGCPEGWTAQVVPGGHFELCAPAPHTCSDGAAFPSGCRALSRPCRDGFPDVVADYYVRVGERGDGSLAAPFGTIAAAIAAAGEREVVVGLSEGTYSLASYSGPGLTVLGCDPRTTRLGNLSVSSSVSLDGVGVNRLLARGARVALRSSRANALDLGMGTRAVLADVEVGSATVASGSALEVGGVTMRSSLLLSSASAALDDLRARNVILSSASATITDSIVNGKLRADSLSRLRLARVEVHAPRGEAILVQGELAVSDALLHTQSASVTLPIGPPTPLSRVWVRGVLYAYDRELVGEGLVFDTSEEPGQPPPGYQFLTVRAQATLSDVYTLGPSKGGLIFHSERSTLTRAELTAHGGFAIKVLGRGLLTATDVTYRAPPDRFVCGFAELYDAALIGERVAAHAPGGIFMAKVTSELALKEARLVGLGRAPADCQQPFVPLFEEGVGVGGYDRSSITLEHFTIEDVTRGVLLNGNSIGALADGVISANTVFSIPDAKKQGPRLLIRVDVSDSAASCEGTTPE